MAKIKLKQLEEYESSSAHSSSSGDIQVSTREEIVGIIPKEETNVLTLYPFFELVRGTCEYVEGPEEENQLNGVSEYVDANGKLPWDTIDFTYVTKKGYVADIFHYVGGNFVTAPKMINTENVISFEQLFMGQSNLTSVQSFDSLENCATFQWMFDGCEKLTTVPDFPRIVDGANCYGMFAGCSALKAAPIIPGCIGNAENMFSGCENLKTVPEYDLSKCTMMCDMFSYCESLEGEFPWEIDLTSCHNINNMFYETKITKVTFKNVPKALNDPVEEIASSINYKNKIEVVIKNVLE